MGGWGQWVSRATLEKYYLIDGLVTFVCAIMVVRDRDSSLPVPALDVGKHFGTLLSDIDVFFLFPI